MDAHGRIPMSGSHPIDEKAWVERMQADTVEVDLEVIRDQPDTFIKCPACGKTLLWVMVERAEGHLKYCCGLLLMSYGWGNLPPGVKLKPEYEYGYAVSKCQLDAIQERVTRPDKNDAEEPC